MKEPIPPEPCVASPQPEAPPPAAAAPPPPATTKTVPSVLVLLKVPGDVKIVTRSLITGSFSGPINPPWLSRLF